MEETQVAFTLPHHVGDWTAEEFFALGETELARMELDEGKLVVSANPMPDHQRIGLRMARLIDPQLPPPFDLAYELDIELSPDTVRAPDLLVTRIDLSGHRTRLIPDQVSLVVEIVSPSSRGTDRLLKPAQYAAAGIPGFWRIELDPEVSLAAYVLDSDAYRAVGTWGPGQVARVEEPIGLTVEIDALTRRRGA